MEPDELKIYWATWAPIDNYHNRYYIEACVVIGLTLTVHFVVALYARIAYFHVKNHKKTGQK